MSWYNEATFYHIYPLGLTGAPKENDYGTPVHRLNTLLPWIDHIKEIGCTALYIGPLFESVGHGYETTDYKKLDSRLGTNEDLTNFVKACHDKGIRVIFDGVFNHTGRDFFAFKDIQKNRENSPYVNWYCNVNFGGNTEYNDGFSYENWGGYNLLVKLNQRNPEVQNYICDVIRFWVSEFDIDGIRLDAADVLDFDFMRVLRHTADEVKKDFWLMGEVIHGDYSRWVNGQTLHSVTNYALHKALYSGHNDHNYFEIAHTVKYLQNMGDLDLYNFVDNHDVERIHTKLQNKAHFAPVHVLLYTLPGVPSIYYGSEFGIDGKKEKFSDASLRPALDLKDYADAVTKNPCTALIAALGKVRQGTPALSYGSYSELALTNRQFAFARDLDGVRVIVTVNNDDSEAEMNLPTGSADEYVGALTGKKVRVEYGRIRVSIAANSGEIWLPAGDMPEYKPVQVEVPETAAAKENESNAPETEENQAAETGSVAEAPSTPEAEASSSQETAAEVPNPDKTPEEMTVGELQAAILAKMAGNGPVTDQMKKTVYDNIWHDSLVNWLKSFR
ncbi:alpha-amylase family glycosyl hydrolase [Blautia sp. MCC283]|uniref:alpha-amylase family glycosyl hydrolase n=1 Tax=Blautia sp. MCC283 TaxID=2592640 RepID=UPI001C016ECE|nr:alpha-amylase family glycosyl hydrolase [Blautia sp. MCC283]MBT9840022.1 alpha-amylase [Blautia sp. MCC283]